MLTEFFKWMTIINVGLLILTFVLTMTLKNVVCKLHGRLFGIQENTVAAAAYGYLGIYRIFVIVFNIVPYISLVLIA